MKERAIMTSGSQRVALVTGGVSAIGTAIARRLTKDGVRVFLGYRRQAAAADEAGSTAT